jgi:hypothetical protein
MVITKFFVSDHDAKVEGQPFSYNLAVDPIYLPRKVTKFKMGATIFDFMFHHTIPRIQAGIMLIVLAIKGAFLPIRKTLLVRFWYSSPRRPEAPDVSGSAGLFRPGPIKTRQGPAPGRSRPGLVRLMAPSRWQKRAESPERFQKI